MSTQTDLARLQSELDDPFTPLLLALADWHEETDQPALARAYRRIAAEGKVPDTREYGWEWWGWAPPSREAKRYELANEHEKNAVDRYRQAMCPIGKALPLSIAYHALALAYAELEKESISG